MSILRGDIFYVENPITSGSEQKNARPAIIVSNDANNATSPVVEVVYLTTRPKKDLPTHVSIRSTGILSTALCEQITSVSVERLGNYIASCSEQEMNLIDVSLMISLGIDSAETDSKVNCTKPMELEIEDLKTKLSGAEKLNDFHRQRCDELKNECESQHEIINALRGELAKACSLAESSKAKYKLLQELYQELACKVGE